MASAKICGACVAVVKNVRMPWTSRECTFQGDDVIALHMQLEPLRQSNHFDSAYVVGISRVRTFAY
jgi:hypothetical protein